MTEDLETPKFPKLDINAVSRTTFAAAQNAVPIIKRISILNETEQEFKKLKLTMKPQPAFCKSKEWTILLKDIVLLLLNFRILGIKI